MMNNCGPHNFFRSHQEKQIGPRKCLKTLYWSHWSYWSYQNKKNRKIGLLDRFTRGFMCLPNLQQFSKKWWTYGTDGTALIISKGYGFSKLDRSGPLY